MRQRVGEQWSSYLENVMPPNAGPTQITETRRAFYAGAQGLLGLLMNVLEPGTDATEADLKTMDEIAAELAEFAKAVARGQK